MLTPEYMADVTHGAEKLAAQLHEQIMKAVIRRLMARAGRGEQFILTATDRWNIDTLQQAGYLYADIVKELADKTGETEEAVRRAMKEAGAAALENDQKIYDLAGIEPIDIKKSPVYMQMMEADYAATNGTIHNLTHTTADAAQKTFINQCDMIYAAVTRGAGDYKRAVRDAVEKIASDDGIYITYPSGHRTSVEAAVTRCVRTGIAQMAGHISEKRANDVGCEHVLVSSHLGARPSHAEWQGKVYRLKGSDEQYPNFREATGYGTGAGLCGWNCRHSFTAFFPDIMKNNFEQYSVDENEEAYNERQERMKREREDRKRRMKQEAYNTAAESTDDAELKKILEEERDRIKAGRQKGNGANKTNSASSSDEKIQWYEKRDKISREQYKELMNYAREKNISLSRFKKYDGDISVIKSVVDDCEKVAKYCPKLFEGEKSLVVELNEFMDANDFASTRGHIISLNANAYRDVVKLSEEYNKLVEDGWFVAGTDYHAIIFHELGHVYQNMHNINDLKIAGSILSGMTPSEILKYLKVNLSYYSGGYSDGREIISECFSSVFNSNVKNDFALRFLSSCGIM